MRGVPHGDLVGWFGTSLSSVKRIIRVHRDTGAARVPRQGQGKKDDPRWVAAGPHEAETLAHLTLLKERSSDDELLIDLHAQVEVLLRRPPAYRTMCHLLRDKLDYTRPPRATVRREPSVGVSRPRNSRSR